MDYDRYRQDDGTLPVWAEDLKKLEKYVLDALQYTGGTHTLQDVADGLHTTKMQLWPGINSAVVTEITITPQQKILHYFLAGGNLRELSLMRPMIEDWAKAQGCNKVTLAGRRGWERTFLKDSGYKPAWYILSKEL